MALEFGLAAPPLPPKLGDTAGAPPESKPGWRELPGQQFTPSLPPRAAQFTPRLTPGDVVPDAGSPAALSASFVVGVKIDSWAPLRAAKSGLARGGQGFPILTDKRPVLCGQMRHRGGRR